tara:strand:+ start:65 stop:235 length:171 start_codon:yes stop_codon:yes gene_type:complete
VSLCNTIPSENKDDTLKFSGELSHDAKKRKIEKIKGDLNKELKMEENMKQLSTIYC